MTLSSKDMAALKAKAQELPAALQMGKAGITDGFLGEVQSHLDREPLVKVKLLKSALESGDKKDLAQEVADKLGATLVELRGHTAVYYKPRKARAKRA